MLLTSGPAKFAADGHRIVGARGTLWSSQGDRALVVGSTGGQNAYVSQAGLTGNLTLSVLDISNPLAPKLLGTTLVTDGWPAARA
jgi:hypothetical protein